MYELQAKAGSAPKNGWADLLKKKDAASNDMPSEVAAPGAAADPGADASKPMMSEPQHSSVGTSTARNSNGAASVALQASSKPAHDAAENGSAEALAAQVSSVATRFKALKSSCKGCDSRSRPCAGTQVSSEEA